MLQSSGHCSVSFSSVGPQPCVTNKWVLPSATTPDKHIVENKWKVVQKNTAFGDTLIFNLGTTREDDLSLLSFCFLSYTMQSITTSEMHED